MDDLDSLISQREVEAVRRQRELDLFVAETRGMAAVRDLQAKPPYSSSLAAATTLYPIESGIPLPPPKKGGRQPGAISQQWRNILRGLYTTEVHGFDAEMVMAYALRENIAIKLKDARDRMEKYAGQGFIEYRDGKYFVTLAAAKKFGFAVAGALGRAALGWGNSVP